MLSMSSVLKECTLKKFLAIVLSVSLLVGTFVFSAPQKAEAARVSGTITLSGSTSVAPLAQELAKAFKKDNPKVTINFTNITGSGAGISDAKNGTVNIGMSSRPLTNAEKAAGLTENILCNDGVAVVVNLSNKLSNIKPQQLYNIYSKSTTNWSSISGSGLKVPIATYGRESGSGTRSCFEDVLKNDFGLNIASNYGSMNGIIPNTGAMQTSVKGNKGAIGYMSLGDMNKKQVKALKFNGVAATIYNVADGSYKMSRPFVYAVKGTPNAQTKAFITWCKGSAAQNIVAKMGFVKKGLMKPVSVKSFTLNKTKVSLAKKGKKVTLKVKTLKPNNATNKKLQFKSSNTKVATVNAKGVVTAKKKGKTTITVRTTDGSNVAKKCRVTVKS